MATHLMALWGLAHIAVSRDAVPPWTPLLVRLIATDESRQVEEIPAARVAAAPRPARPILPTPATPRSTLAATGPEPATDTTSEIAPEKPAPAATPAAPSVDARAEAALPALTVVQAPAEALPPRQIPSAAVQYIEPPVVEYPRASRRHNEAGLVVVRAYIDATGGAPRRVEIDQSSGFARLDQAAVAAVMKARFRPYSENGRAVEGWARIPVVFELEK